MAVKRETDKFVAQNRRAKFDYFILDKLEAGIMLRGTEVKSLRGGQGSIAEAYAAEQDGELFLVNAFIPEYKSASQFNHDPRRKRKLLVRRRELDRLLGQVKRDGVTLVPISVYFNDRGIAKLELGVAKGKRKADKRDAEKTRDWQRDKARIMRDRG